MQGWVRLREPRREAAGRRPVCLGVGPPSLRRCILWSAGLSVSSTLHSTAHRVAPEPHPALRGMQGWVRLHGSCKETAGKRLVRLRAGSSPLRPCMLWNAGPSVSSTLHSTAHRVAPEPHPALRGMRGWVRLHGSCKETAGKRLVRLRAGSSPLRRCILWSAGLSVSSTLHFTAHRVAPEPHPACRCMQGWVRLHGSCKETAGKRLVRLRAGSSPLRPCMLWNAGSVRRPQPAPYSMQGDSLLREPCREAAGKRLVRFGASPPTL